MSEETHFDVLNGKLDKIIAMLSDRSKEIAEVEVKSEHVSGVNIEKDSDGEKSHIENFSGVEKRKIVDGSKPTEPESSVREIIQGIVRIVTDKAVQVVVGINAAWVPKSAIKNLSEVVLEQGKPVELVLHSWFAPKVEWKVI